VGDDADGRSNDTITQQPLCSWWIAQCSLTRLLTFERWWPVTAESSPARDLPNGTAQPDRQTTPFSPDGTLLLLARARRQPGERAGMALGRPACWVLTRGEPLAGGKCNAQGRERSVRAGPRESAKSGLWPTRLRCGGQTSFKCASSTRVLKLDPAVRLRYEMGRHTGPRSRCCSVLIVPKACWMSRVWVWMGGLPHGHLPQRFRRD